MNWTPIELVADGAASSPPLDLVPFTGFNDNLAVLLAVPDHKILARIGRQDHQRLDDGGFPAVIGAYQHGQALGWLNDRILMGHEIMERNATNHSSASVWRVPLGYWRWPNCNEFCRNASRNLSRGGWQGLSWGTMGLAD